MSHDGASPPATAAEILEAVGPRAKLIFESVRSIVDDVDRAAPWGQLYCPPTSEERFLTTQRRLLEVVEGIPARVQTVFDQLEQLRGPGDMSAGELAGFFDTTFIITSRDQDQLTKAVNNPNGQPWTSERRNRVCQLAADLKGKYQSALMGVAGKVIAQGRWSGVEIEPVLFVEKRREFERNHELVQDLDRVTGLIKKISGEMPLAKLINAWKNQQRTDRYALVDLTIIVGEVGALLKEETRRALYSGDYHQILSHERELAERVNKLQIMHASTWSETTTMNLGGIFPRLVELTTEIAAILDLQLLKTLIDEDRFAAIRARVEDATKAPPEHPDHEERLVQLIRDGDMRTFLEALLGNVMKRESLVAERTIVPTGEMTGDGAALAELRKVMATLLSPDRPQWQAFLAASVEPRTAPILAMELVRDLSKRLVPLLEATDSVAQFGTVLATTCQGIRSSVDRQPMQTALRLLNRLQVVLAEMDDDR